MDLSKCRDCGNEVSSSASSCQKCGCSRPSSPIHPSAGTALVVLVLMIVMSVCVVTAPDPKPLPPELRHLEPDMSFQDLRGAVLKETE